MCASVMQLYWVGIFSTIEIRRLLFEKVGSTLRDYRTVTPVSWFRKVTFQSVSPFSASYFSFVDASGSLCFLVILFKSCRIAMILKEEHPHQSIETAANAARQAQVRWRMAHLKALSRTRTPAHGNCCGRVVSKNHFFKHSRAFLWFLLCNLVMNADAFAHSQLLINVQNQVRNRKKKWFKTLKSQQRKTQQRQTATLAALPIWFSNISFRKFARQNKTNLKRERMRERKRGAQDK